MEKWLESFAPYIDMFMQSAVWFVIVLIIFIPLSRLFPSKRTQPLFRKDMAADSAYWFLGPYLYNPIFQWFIAFYFSFHAVQNMYGYGISNLATLPLWLQALLILLIGDFFQYWLHRFFHRDPLWKYHAIHHSSTEVDWLSSARFHPINIIIYSTAINALIVTMGFSVEAFKILLPFNMIYSPLVHANVGWTYGPFKYVLASPVFHRWHHTYQHEGGNKNFAPTFSFLDVIFGTFYMPKGKIPEVFGIEGDPVPDDFLGQLAYPFKSKKE
jgi:sterol desaturase/sphingolipid hydroxylase (fatty acid hydroxylase superfamily)